MGLTMADKEFETEIELECKECETRQKELERDFIWSMTPYVLLLMLSGVGTAYFAYRLIFG